MKRAVPISTSWRNTVRSPSATIPIFCGVVSTMWRLRQEPSFIQPLISPGAEALAAELIAVAPGELRHVTFTNSGAESVEVGIKIARAATGRPTILSTSSGFHGKTLGAVSATGPACYRDPFLVDTSSFEHVPFDNLECLEARLARRDVAAFFVEAVQGEGGMITRRQAISARLRRSAGGTARCSCSTRCRRDLAARGVFSHPNTKRSRPTCCCSPGRWAAGSFHSERVCTEKAWTRNFGYYHSSTFANNHLTCSVGLAALRHLLAADGGLMRAVREKGNTCATAFRRSSAAIRERLPIRAAWG